MKNGFIIWLLFLICAAGGGYWAGRHHTAPAPSSAPSAAASTDASPPNLPPVNTAPDIGTDKTDDAPLGKMSLADIEAGLLDLKSRGDFAMNNDPGMKWTKLMIEVNTPDIPQILAFADKNLTSAMRSTVRTDLLTRWADGNVSAAMAYANGIADKSERESAIGLVTQS